VIWRATHEPFGLATPDEDPDGDLQTFTLDLRFPGQVFDPESGSYYNYFRTYDPTVGRYFEVDPIGQLGGINVYAYASSNALNRIDPFGLIDFGDAINAHVARQRPPAPPAVVEPLVVIVRYPTAIEPTDSSSPDVPPDPPDPPGHCPDDNPPKDCSPAGQAACLLKCARATAKPGRAADALTVNKCRANCVSGCLG
jgi:RHS repeat-associated protein